MVNFLSQLKSLKGSKSKAQRVGRGYGGRGGHTVGRGSKGQNSRSGGKRNLYFEGGQTPLVKKMPYRGGFTNPNSKNVIIFNLGALMELVDEAENLSPETLIEKGLLENGAYDEVKLLGRGSINKKVEFNGFTYSKTARKKIEEAGGKAK